jgi:hypothetical protein
VIRAKSAVDQKLPADLKIEDLNATVAACYFMGLPLFGQPAKRIGLIARVGIVDDGKGNPRW